MHRTTYKTPQQSNNLTAHYPKIPLHLHLQIHQTSPRSYPSTPKHAKC